MKTAPDPGPGPFRGLRLLPPEHQLGWTPYLWLVYLAFFLIEPALRLRHGTIEVAGALAAAAALLVFLGSYFRGYWVQGRDLLVVIALQTLLGVVMTPISIGSSVFFIYASSFAGRLHHARTAAYVIVVISATGALTSWSAAVPAWYWIPAVGMPLVIGYVSFHDARVRRADAKLRLAHEQIEHLAAVAERERIARDLHDLLGHTLSLIVLKSELAAKLMSRDVERAANEVRDVEQVARRALKEVREAIRGYRASLADEVRRSRSILGAAGILARFDVELGEPLARPSEEALALALREAVTNVTRHSDARTCRAWLQREGDAYALVVEDDGRGADGVDGSGLRGMRERVEAVGGTVRRGSGSGARGLRVEVRVPTNAPFGAPEEGTDSVGHS